MQLINRDVVIVDNEPTHLVIRKAIIHGKDTFFMHVEKANDSYDPKAHYANDYDTKVVEL